ncbi:MAG: hypothetical protein ABSG65_33860 [Bryobacteraceae bacterium]|jgi:hypothetical protein
MKSREAELRDLVRDWLRKGDLDCDVAARLASEGGSTTSSASRSRRWRKNWAARSR